MVGSILAEGQRGLVAGNIGIPVLGLVDAVAADKIVCLELSSFQLESCPTFRPRAAMLLNIRPDHLDRYPDMAEYLDAKLNLFRNLTGPAGGTAGR
jgi:UDP-N-acetylmuramoylalanine--D-glutamate ligase